MQAIKKTHCSEHDGTGMPAAPNLAVLTVQNVPVRVHVKLLNASHTLTASPYQLPSFPGPPEKLGNFDSTLQTDS